MKQVSDIDKKHFDLIRSNIDNLIVNASLEYDKEGISILDVAPQTHQGVKKYFKFASVKTLDIDPSYNSDYVCDLANAEIIEDNKFDVVFCTEVLEHTNNPFACVETINRILKNGGVCFISTPFNFRIHNPLPDNWRFTEHGLRVLFSSFKEVQIDPLEDENRFLMPIQYITIARKLR